MERAFKAAVGVFAFVLACTAVLIVVMFIFVRRESSRFGCRSRASEAKVGLMGLYNAEKAFYGEYNTYSSDLDAIDWAPDGSPRYLFGFARRGGPDRIEGVADFDPSRKDTRNERVVQGPTGPRYSTARM